MLKNTFAGRAKVLVSPPWLSRSWSARSCSSSPLHYLRRHLFWRLWAIASAISSGRRARWRRTA
eukprot:7638506-Lingulodinium_polyedra.AAC.1